MGLPASAASRFRVGVGLWVIDPGRVAVGNLHGFTEISIDATSGTLTGNSFVGNRDDGVQVNSAFFSVTKNNIFGNVGAGGDNCGLNAEFGTLTAPGNFFGAATGPGADPADDVCNGTITTTPLGTKEIKVKVTSP